MNLNFSSQFQNLIWENLQSNHQKYWELLEKKYDLSPKQLQKPVSLDDLAIQCVELCQHHLFTSWYLPEDLWQQNFQGVSCKDGWQVADKLCLKCEMLLNRLGPALCDHLIVTFAYGFCQDNLVPVKMDEMINQKIFPCFKAPVLKVNEETDKENEDYRLQKDEYNTARKNFHKSKKDSYNSYRKAILETVAWYGEAFQEDVAARGIQIDQLKLQEAFKALEISCLKNMETAPQWMFSLLMATSWKNSPYSIVLRKNGKNNGIFKYIGDIDSNISSRNLLVQQTEFIGTNPLCKLIFKEAVDSSAESILPYVPAEDRESSKDMKRVFPLMHLRTAQPSANLIPIEFVAIPYSSASKLQASNVLPAQQYKVLSGEVTVKIPIDVQYMFNSYLFERNFHGYAASVMLKEISPYLNGNASKGQLFQMESLSRIIRLRAPLLHVQLIYLLSKIVASYPRERNMTKWIEPYLDYWNSVALPILEEFFLWGVYEFYRYQSKDTVEQMFERLWHSFTGSDSGMSRCERLNHFRLVQLPKSMHKIDEKFVKALPPQINRIMGKVYYSGLGLLTVDSQMDTPHFDTTLYQPFG